MGGHSTLFNAPPAMQMRFLVHVVFILFFWSLKSKFHYKMQRVPRSGVILPDSWANFPVTPAALREEGSGAEEADDMSRTEPWEGNGTDVHFLFMDCDRFSCHVVLFRLWAGLIIYYVYTVKCYISKIYRYGVLLFLRPVCSLSVSVDVMLEWKSQKPEDAVKRTTATNLCKLTENW